MEYLFFKYWNIQNFDNSQLESREKQPPLRKRYFGVLHSRQERETVRSPSDIDSKHVCVSCKSFNKYACYIIMRILFRFRQFSRIHPHSIGCLPRAPHRAMRRLSVLQRMHLQVSEDVRILREQAQEDRNLVYDAYMEVWWFVT